MTTTATQNTSPTLTTSNPLQSFYTTTATEARLDFLPKHFGAQFMTAENLLFDLARKTMPDYKSGYWEFAELGDANLPLMFLRTEGKPVRMQTLFGDNEAVLPSELAGVALTMLVHLLIVQRADRYRLSDALHDQYLERYFELQRIGYSMAAACDHTEAFHRLID